MGECALCWDRRIHDGPLSPVVAAGPRGPARRCSRSEGGLNWKPRLVDLIAMSRKGRSLFDPSRIPAVERFRCAVAESFPTEKGVWTPFLEAVYEHFVDSIGGKATAAQLDAVLRAVGGCEIDSDEPDPYCARLRAKLRDQVVLFLCMKDEIGSERAVRLVKSRVREAVRAWERSRPS